MVSQTYAKAYTEVLEIIKYLPKSEFEKISKKEIEYYELNKDYNYKFLINPHISLTKQDISSEAYAIIVNIFRDFFASEEQKKKLHALLKQNQNQKEKKLREKYNPDNIFKDHKSSNTAEINDEKKKIENSAIMVMNKKENIFTKIKKLIKNFLDREKRENGS